MNDVEAFKAAREGLGWTQRDAADALGVTQAAVCRWEAGLRRLPAAQLKRLLELGEQGSEQAWRTRAEDAEQRAADLAAELEQARASIKELELDRELDGRHIKHWKQRAHAAELERDKLKLRVEERARRDAEYTRRWNETMGEPPPSSPPPAHPYSAADLADLAALGLNERASWEQIKQAGRDAARKHHPDKQGDAGEFQRTRAAFDRLKARHAPSSKGAA
jgi:transcriptional regulator with XRE-family HTH domain